jgi:hypothetical protein
VDALGKSLPPVAEMAVTGVEARVGDERGRCPLPGAIAFLKCCSRYRLATEQAHLMDTANQPAERPVMQPSVAPAAAVRNVQIGGSGAAILLGRLTQRKWGRRAPCLLAAGMLAGTGRGSGLTT